MSLRAATCSVGLKPFQKEFSDKLAIEELCVAAGFLPNPNNQQLSKAILVTLESATQLSAVAM